MADQKICRHFGYQYLALADVWKIFAKGDLQRSGYEPYWFQNARCQYTNDNPVQRDINDVILHCNSERIGFV